MAVTGVGLQPSLHITLLLISPPCYLSLPICRPVSHSLPLFLRLSPSFTEFLSSLIVVARGDAVVAVVIVQKKREIYFLFYFFSSSWRYIPPMLKGLDYFCVWCSAFFLYFLFTERSLEEEQQICAIHSTLVLLRCSLKMHDNADAETSFQH